MGSPLAIVRGRGAAPAARGLPMLGAVAEPTNAPRWPLLAKGFRPFFLLAAAYAALFVPVWVLVFTGEAAAGAYLPAFTWHVHEMVFGFAVAVLAGFLLTAVGNWTQRETAVGGALAALTGLWVAGRVAMFAAASWPRGAAALVDLAFLPALGLALAKPLVGTGNRRNYVMLVVLAALFAANAAMHAEALGVLSPGIGARAGVVAVDVLVFVVAAMAGRVFPMFTRNATAVSSIRNVPALDASALAALAALVLSDALAPGHAVGTWTAGLAAVAVALRARTWGARHSLGNPLLWILHASHAWLAIGLGLRVATRWVPSLPPSTWAHALTVGAIASACLGMMARVSLGHTGRALVAPRVVVLAFGALQLAAAVRAFGPWLVPSAHVASVVVAGALWSAAFVAYAASYAPVLFRPRVDGKAG